MVVTATESPRTSAGRGRKESLADILRRRSDGHPGSANAQATRATAVQHSLDALTRNAEGRLVDVPLEELHANPFQPRFQFQRQPLEELAQSLASEGQLEPVIARRVIRDGQPILEIVAGARRLEAARICNSSIRSFPTLRADVRELTDEEAERLSLIENLQRENLTPLEEGYRYWQLQQRDPRKWSVRSIADFVHKKKSTVQNRLGLVRDAAVAEAVLREQIPPTAGFHLLRLPAPEREAYLRTAIEQRLTVEQVRQGVDRRVGARRANDLDQRRGMAALPGDGDDAIGLDGASDGSGLVYVAAHRRRAASRPGNEGPDASQFHRREALEARRAAIQERINALEAELRAQFSALRTVERELGLLAD